MLTCAVCSERYTFKAFPSRKVCSRACQAENDRRRRRDWLDKPATRARRIYSQAKARAAGKGIPFTITLESLVARFERGVCEVSGLPLDFAGSDEKHLTPFAPSLDQIAPGEGYTPTNTHVVCWIYNQAKGQADLQDVLRLARALVSRYGTSEVDSLTG